MSPSRGVLGLPLLMFAFAVTLSNTAQRRPFSLLSEAQRLESGGRPLEAAAAYRNLVAEYPGTPAGCSALWELASLEYAAMQAPEEAVHTLSRLIDSCAGNRLVGEAMLMIADIHQIDLRDLEQSNRIRHDYLELVSDSGRSHETLFKIGDALFQQGRYPEARSTLENLLAQGPEEEIASPANLRIGTMLQVAGDYDRSIGYFEAVIRQSRSPEFRLQARLGLIESYEFLNRLEQALEIARNIRADEYPTRLKNDMLLRLNQKRLHSRPY